MKWRIRVEQEPEYGKTRKETHNQNKAKKLFTRIRLPVQSFLNASWKGASYGATLITMLLIFAIGFDFHTGLGKLVDVVLFFLIAIIGTWVAVKMGEWLINRVKKLPTLFIASLGISLTITIYTLDQFRSLENILPLAYLLVAIGVITGVLFGYPLTTGLKKPVSIIVLLLGVFVTGIFCYWLFTPGTLDERLANTVEPFSTVSQNPSEYGSLEVNTFTYGSGTDKQRDEFGNEVDLQTRSVNASSMIGEWSKEREWFWGFKDANVPLNGRVFMPKGEGPFPLVLIVHGNHKMEDFSDEGYNYLGELLASRGFLTVSVDENFFNSSWSGGLSGDINGRAWLLLKHIEEIESLSTQQDTQFFNKVDMDHIALIGHSRGGQAAILATKFNELDRYPNNANMRFDFNYKIETVIALAPTDYQTLSDRKIEVDDVNYLLLGGSYDSDLSEFEGDRQYNGIQLTGSESAMKSSLYIDGANHGQFNTTWGENDTYFPFTLLLNKQPLLEGDEQRQIARTYVSGFLEATLHEDESYQPMFEDYRYALEWLPKTTYISQYEDPSYHIFSDFEEDVNVLTSTSPYIDIDANSFIQWYEGELEFRRDKERGTHGVFLKWDQSYSKNASYSLDLTKPLQDPYHFTPNSALTFTAANVSEAEDQQPVDFRVTVTSANGESSSVLVSDIMPMHGALPIQHTKTKFFEERRYGEPTEPVLQTFNIPVHLFKKENSFVKLDEIDSITFEFNASSKGKIFLDQIGVNQPN